VQNNLGVARERTGDMDGARESYARSALLAPKYVKAQINGARTAMLRTGTDGGVDASHVPEGATARSEPATSGRQFRGRRFPGSRGVGLGAFPVLRSPLPRS